MSKKTNLMLGLCLLLATATAFSWPSSLTCRSKHTAVSVPVTLHDFGQVTAGEVLQTRFAVKNDGDRRLLLRQRKTSCECISGTSRPMIIEPGASTIITATLDTEKLQGAYQMELHYTTSAPNLPNFTLIVRATVRLPELADAL